MTDIDRLCDLLAEETRTWGELSHVLRDQQRAVVDLRSDDILLGLGRRDVLQERLLQLADERRAAVRSAAAERGSASPQAVELLPLLPLEPQGRVRGHLRDLRAALLHARSLERQTAHLIGSGLDTVSELLRTLRSLVPGARYDADATLTVPVPQDRVSRTA